MQREIKIGRSVGWDFLTGLIGSVFSSKSSLETCTSSSRWPFSTLLSGSKWGNVVDWLTKKRELCIFADTQCFFSFPFVCARCFEVRAEPSVSFYCPYCLSLPFMGKKKMSVCSWTAFLHFKMQQNPEFTGAHTRFATRFFLMIDHMLFGFFFQEFSY